MDNKYIGLVEESGVYQIYKLGQSDPVYSSDAQDGYLKGFASQYPNIAIERGNTTIITNCDNGNTKVLHGGRFSISYDGQLAGTYQNVSKGIEFYLNANSNGNWYEKSKTIFHFQEDQYIYSSSISPSGDVVQLSIYNNEQIMKTVYINTNTGDIIRELPGIVEVSMQWNYLYYSSSYGISLWRIDNISTMSLSPMKSPPSNRVYAISPDGLWLAGQYEIFSTEAPKQRDRTIYYYGLFPYPIDVGWPVHSFSFNNEMLALNDMEGNINIIDIKNKSLNTVIERLHPFMYNVISVSDDAIAFLTYSAVEVRRRKEFSPLQRITVRDSVYDPWLGHISFSRDSNFIAHNASLYDTANGKSIIDGREERGGEEFLAFAFSNDSRYFACDNRVVINIYSLPEAVLWKTINLPKEYGDRTVGSMKFTADGKRLIIGTYTGSIIIWNLETDSAEKILNINSIKILGVDIDTNQSHIAIVNDTSFAANRRASVIILSYPELIVEKTINLVNECNCVLMSKAQYNYDGTLLAIYKYNSLELWDTQKWTILRTWNNTMGFTLSDDGLFLFTLEGSINVYGITK